MAHAVKDTDTKLKAAESPRSFSGSTATTGNSQGMRLEKAFFRAAPEFNKTGSPIQVDIIGPGAFLVRINETTPQDTDPIIGAWLSFLDKDIKSNPGHLARLMQTETTALEELVKTVVVDDNYELPADVTF